MKGSLTSHRNIWTLERAATETKAADEGLPSCSFRSNIIVKDIFGASTNTAAATMAGVAGSSPNVLLRQQ